MGKQTRESMGTDIRISFNPAGCKECGACIELAPECFIEDEITGRPYLKNDCVSEELANKLIAYCSEHCIEIEEDA